MAREADLEQPHRRVRVGGVVDWLCVLCMCSRAVAVVFLMQNLIGRTLVSSTSTRTNRGSVQRIEGIRFRACAIPTLTSATPDSRSLHHTPAPTTPFTSYNYTLTHQHPVGADTAAHCRRRCPSTASGLALTVATATHGCDESTLPGSCTAQSLLVGTKTVQHRRRPGPASQTKPTTRQHRQHNNKGA